MSIDFSNKQFTIVPYNFGDIVSRENFINFLILSYAVSRGNIVIQKVFFLMTEKKVGFPYKESIENLFQNGSFEALTVKEQELFEKAFRSVKKHMEQWIEDEIHDEIRDEFDGLYDRKETQGEVILNTALGFFDFNEINSITDFIKVSTDFNKRTKNALN